MKISHLVLWSVLMIQLGLLVGCAHSSRKPPGAERPTDKQSASERQRLLALYSRSDVAEISPVTPRAPIGRRTVFDLTSLVHRNAASLKTCYRLVRGRSGTEPIRLDVELETGGRRVRSVQITGTRNGRLERCLTRKIRRWRLPALTPRNVSVPLVFHGS